MNKFIVLEGLDGSGKSTQIDLLKGYFDEQNIDYKYFHFPQTETPYFGEMIARFLRGEFGDINQVDPYLVAMLYAGDRFSAEGDIREWLNINSVVIVDRYVLSNIAFQCAKIKDEKEKNKLRQWIFNFEFNHYKIPRPGLSIFLDVPMSFIETNLKNDRAGANRSYLQGKQDIHEAHIDFQRAVREEYLAAIKLDKSFERINCNDNGKMKETAAVFEEIKKLLYEKKIIE